MPSSAAREYAHPTERDLIVVKNRQGERCFAIVEQQKHTFFRSTEGPSCEVLIDVKLSGQFGVVEKSEVELSVVKSLTNEIRQWIGLINFHTSLLARDLLYPRGREYFCHSSVSQPTLKVSIREKIVSLDHLNTLMWFLDLRCVQSEPEREHSDCCTCHVCSVCTAQSTATARPTRHWQNSHHIWTDTGWISSECSSYLCQCVPSMFICFNLVLLYISP